jgi:Na+-driven multidrug efflux pump
MLSAFLRNDSNPGLATKAVMLGGVINVFGDYLLVFLFDLGILGAGIATAFSACISLMVMLTHFFSRRHTLRLKRPYRLFLKTGKIITAGFSTFFIDIAMGLLTMLFNRQIMRYSGTDSLAVYGVIVNISTFVQCCAYGVGQAAQPILSINFGAQKQERINKLLRYSFITVAAVSGIWVTLTMLIPNSFVSLYMAPTQSVLKIAPSIIRCYCLSFLLLPFNVFSTYYFQSVMKPGISFVISLSRGILISGTLIMLLPVFVGSDALWAAMPVTELAVSLFIIRCMRKQHRDQPAILNME